MIRQDIGRRAAMSGCLLPCDPHQARHKSGLAQWPTGEPGEARRGLDDAPRHARNITRSQADAHLIADDARGARAPAVRGTPEPCGTKGRHTRPLPPPAGPLPPATEAPNHGWRFGATAVEGGTRRG
eukprot:9927877-Alexandrium_andersonii.AAC.2